MAFIQETLDKGESLRNLLAAPLLSATDERLNSRNRVFALVSLQTCREMSLYKLRPPSSSFLSWTKTGCKISYSSWARFISIQIGRQTVLTNLFTRCLRVYHNSFVDMRRIRIY